MTSVVNLQIGALSLLHTTSSLLIHACNDVATGCLFIGHRLDLPPKHHTIPMWHQAVWNDVAPGCLFIGYRLDLPSKTSHDHHVSPRGFYLWEPRTYRSCDSNVSDPTGFPAEHGDCNQTLGAVTWRDMIFIQEKGSIETSIRFWHYIFVQFRRWRIKPRFQTMFRWKRHAVRGFNIDKHGVLVKLQWAATYYYWHPLCKMKNDICSLRNII
jgi:hypothetical protein